MRTIPALPASDAAIAARRRSDAETIAALSAENAALERRVRMLEWALRSAARKLRKIRQSLGG